MLTANSIEQKPAWEVIDYSSSQEILRIFTETRKFNTATQLDPIFRHIDGVHAPNSIFEDFFNII